MSRESGQPPAAIRTRPGLSLHVMRARANAESWRIQPFVKGVPIPYRAKFNAVQFEQLKDGYVPVDFDDRWFIYYDEPGLFIHRSWGGAPFYRVTLRASEAGGAEVTDSQCAEEMLQREKPDGHARLLDWLISTMFEPGKPYPSRREHDGPVTGPFEY